MNKTLLLIICDFLLLNLLALTRWEKAEPEQPQPQIATSSNEGQKSKDDDLVDAMKLSLEDERAQRDSLAQKLQSTELTLQQKEQNLSQLQTEKSQLASNLTETQKSAQELAQKVEAASRDAMVSKERLAQMQKDLEQRQREAEEQRKALTQLEQQHNQAREKIENLNVAVKVAEQEKALYRERVESLKSEVEVERLERQKVQETAKQLAEGVGTIAEKTGEMTREIRENRPINANTLFSEFLANRVSTQFTTVRKAFIGGSKTETKDSRTIFVTDGKDTYAVLHVDDTPFPIRLMGPDYEKIQVTMSHGGFKATGQRLHFLSVDPRIVAIPVNAEQVKAAGVKVYTTALEPFKFPDAVLISNGGEGYGEAPFRLDPALPSYVQLENRLVKRLFGNFSPSRGDLVLSRTGELLGIMANSDYCAVINNFLPAKTVTTGDNVTSQKTSEVFLQLTGRLERLPLKLQ